MLTCDEFVDREIIKQCHIGKFFKQKNLNSIQIATIHQNDKKIRILTPEIKISPYNKFDKNTRVGSNTMSLQITNNKGMCELLNNVIFPFDNMFETPEIKNILGLNEKKKIYIPLVHNDQLKLKIFNMKLTVIDSNNNISNFTITPKNTSDINKYLTHNSRIKMILNVDKIWSNMNMYGVRIICDHFLILNGSNIGDNILDKYKITDDYDIDEEEIKL